MKYFSDLRLSDSLQSALSNEFKFKEMKKIQADTIPLLLEGKDVMATAKTGSGKTLAFLIPIVEMLLLDGGVKAKFGTAAIIIVPTRELADQIYHQLSILTTHCQSLLSIACLKGGTKKKDDVKILKQGMSILVCSPGRLLDHLLSTSEFCWSKLRFLVLDEADQLLDRGFEDQLKSIARILPKKRQTMMFSATLNEKTRNLAAAVLKTDCIFHKASEDVSDANVMFTNSDLLGGVVAKDEECSVATDTATVSGLRQFFTFYESREKFALLYRLLKACLKKKRSQRVMVFMAACAEVKFYYELLNMISVSVEAIHGHKKQSARKKACDAFLGGKVSILLCTDVAARGLDFPNVDWIIQYDAPADAVGYIHRVGRTARAGKSGHALLLLRNSERNFLHELRQANVHAKPSVLNLNSDRNEMDVKNVTKIVNANRWLHQSAVEGYKSYLRSYTSYNINSFDTRRLDLVAVAMSFGLLKAPTVELNVAHARISRKRKPNRRNEENQGKKARRSSLVQ